MAQFIFLVGEKYFPSWRKKKEKDYYNGPLLPFHKMDSASTFLQFIQ